MGWFFVPVGVADFDCSFGGNSFCRDVEFAVFVGEPEQHCYFVAWDPGLDWFAEESLPDDVEWVLMPCWGFVETVVFSGGGLGRSGINSNFTLWAIVCPGLEITNSAQEKGSSAMRRWACIMGRIRCFSNSFVWRNVKMAVINVPKAKIAKIMFII